MTEYERQKLAIYKRLRSLSAQPTVPELCAATGFDADAVEAILRRGAADSETHALKGKWKMTGIGEREYQKLSAKLECGKDRENQGRPDPEGEPAASYTEEAPVLPDGMELVTMVRTTHDGRLHGSVASAMLHVHLSEREKAVAEWLKNEPDPTEHLTVRDSVMAFVEWEYKQTFGFERHGL